MAEIKTIPIKAGIIGCGYVSRYHLRALQSLDFVEVVGVCDQDRERARRLGDEFGVAVLRNLNELKERGAQVIHVLTPPDTHCALTVEALRSGCHVFVEKPMAPTVAECDVMISAAQKADRVLSVNHSARMDPVVLRALELVRSGVCGDVLAVDFLRSSDYAPYAGGPFPPHYNLGSYPFQDLGVHGLYLFEAFLGEIKDLDIRPLATGRHTLLMFDEWHGLIQCEKGVGHMHLSWNAQPMQNELIVHGTRGTLHVDCYLQVCTVRKRIPAPKPVQRLYAAIANSATTIGTVTANTFRMLTGRLRPSPGIHNSVREFYGALRRGTALPVAAHEGRRIMAWVEQVSHQPDAILRAARALRASAQPAPARVLVTGASGFLGSALVARLAEQGESPRVLLRKLNSNIGSNSKAKIVDGDLGNPDDVDRAVSGVEIVYHVGAAMSGATEDFECATVWGTRNIIDACVKHGVKRLVHVSTLSVLDHAGRQRGQDVTEATRLEPHPDWRGHYTRTKLVAEELVREAARSRGLPAVILRPGMIFGPSPNPAAPSGAIGLAGRWIVYGAGNYPLPLVYIDDVVDALLSAAREDAALGGVFQIVGVDSLTQRQYIDAYKKSERKCPRVHYVPRAIFYAASVVAEILGRLLRRPVPLTRYRVKSLPPLSPFDLRAATGVLGWTPRVGVREGLRRTFPAGQAPSSPEAIPAPANELAN